MNIEEEIFKKTHVSFDKLEKNGFKKLKITIHILKHLWKEVFRPK